ncbi:transposase [Chloroflexus sp.]|uniref:transposase n=1 Tax=Chloroflexus sp. TaxID=1904827 RepID=UPI003A0FCB0F
MTSLTTNRRYRTAHLQEKSAQGRPCNDNRRILNGMLYVLHTGCAWADLPKEYGLPGTYWRRWLAWSQDGTWERIWSSL